MPGAGGEASGSNPVPGTCGEAESRGDLQEIPELSEGAIGDGLSCSEVDSESEELVEGIPANHLMTHLPKSRDCDTCKRAKLYEAPHRRHENMQSSNLREARQIEASKTYLDKLSIDHIVTREEVGFRGEENTMTSLLG